MTTDSFALARVLAIDDDAMTRNLLERMLGALGITQVRCEADVGPIVSLVADFDPDVVMLDLHMGAMDGFTALELLAEGDTDVGRRSILLVTGDSDPLVKRRALELGARDVLVKPFARQELADMLASLLEQSARSRETPPT